MFKTSAIHPPPNKLGGGLLAEDDKTLFLGRREIIWLSSFSYAPL